MLSRDDDDRQRVEEPRGLIPDVGSGGRECGSVNNILCLKNLECKSEARSILICTQSERERERVRVRGTKEFLIIQNGNNNQLGYKNQFIY